MSSANIAKTMMSQTTMSTDEVLRGIRPYQVLICQKTMMSQTTMSTDVM